MLNHQYQTTAISVLDLLLLSSSDRIGALHFQSSPEDYMPQYENNANLDQLLEAAKLVELGKPLSPALAAALMHGTSVGGARPKTLIDENNKKHIAKFSSSTDIFPIVQAEFAAMHLASELSLKVASVRLVTTAGKKVLLIERFDREKNRGEWHRKFLVSALTLLNLGDSEGRYASYLDLADLMRKYCKNPINDLHELFRRMVFNILIGNTDDHAKNHSFFWDGEYYQLTPAYDICPYLRVGQQATQAMTVGTMGTFSLLANALTAAPWFELSKEEADHEIKRLTEGVNSHWQAACDKAELTKHQHGQLTKTAVLNPYCFYNEP